VGIVVTAGEKKTGPPEAQRQVKPRLWPELPQWPGVPGRQQQQPDDRPGPALWQWEQPGDGAPVAASRPPGRERTAPKSKARIRKRVATILFMDNILSR